MHIRLVQESIDYSALVERARNPASGAVVLFLGTVREMSEGKAVDGLEYDAYPPMAVKKLEEVAAQARERWPLQSVVIEHRYGRLELGDIAVAIVTASMHRAEAFEAAKWMMDAIKEVVPIWKREEWRAGGSNWVHPERVQASASRDSK